MSDRWRCPYCHDVMDRRFRRTHLLTEWLVRRLQRINGND